MSLVVAQLDRDALTLVADTKVTWRADPTRTRRTFENVQPKILLLAPALAVGFAGNFDDVLLETLTSLRDRPVDQILKALGPVAEVTFVVVDASGPRLWTAGDGAVEDRTELGRAWAGSREAYEVFRQKESECPPMFPTDLVLTSSMQALTSFNIVEEVGGYTLTAAARPGEVFRFVPMPQTTFPAMFDGFTFDPGQAVHIRQAAGTGDTFSAFGLWMANLSRGLLFTHGEPWAPVVIDAPTAEAFIQVASEVHGQSLAM